MNRRIRFRDEWTNGRHSIYHVRRESRIKTHLGNFVALALLVAWAVVTLVFAAPR